AGEVERRHALLPTLRKRRVRGARPRDDECVIVAERRGGQVADPRYGERRAFRRDADARTVEVSWAVGRRAPEEQNEPPHEEIGERAARGLPAHLLRTDDGPARAAEVDRERGGVLRHRTRVEERSAEPGDREHAHECPT